jgi:iron(II)-dependent oxidoreductase
MLTTLAIDRSAAINWYRRNRIRSEQIFDLIEPSAYYTRPIALRNPIVFYEGHLPAFSVIAFLRRGLGKAAIDPRLENLFARGIDPDSEQNAAPRSGASTVWPSRDEVRAFARACDEAILTALNEHEVLPLEGLYTALEHEAMHQETLLYMWHRLPYDQKRRPASGEGRGAKGAGRGATDQRRAKGEGREASRGNAKVLAASPAAAVVPAGQARLGANRDTAAFGWDNEFDEHWVDVDAFEIDTLPVTNAQYLEFVKAGGYQTRELWDNEGWSWVQAEQVQHPAFWLPDVPAPRPSPYAPRQWHWRGMFDAIPLPADWPVYVSHAEASAYARWKGRRLMTEAEFHRAAYSTPSGDDRDRSGTAHGHFDFAGFDPVPVGSFPANAWGVHDLIGNGWEWTSTIFGPFPGFSPMASYPEYSADFFDGQHYVMKGASPATAGELVRPSFRNWFRGNYPFVYAKFRTVK